VGTSGHVLPIDDPGAAEPALGKATTPQQAGVPVGV
jgi:hypothetical protein